MANHSNGFSLHPSPLPARQTFAFYSSPQATRTSEPDHKQHPFAPASNNSNVASSVPKPTAPADLKNRLFSFDPAVSLGSTLSPAKNRKPTYSTVSPAKIKEQATALNTSAGTARIVASSDVAAGNNSRQNGPGTSPAPMEVTQSSQSVRAKEARKSDEFASERVAKSRRLEGDVSDPTSPFHFIDLCRRGMNTQDFVYLVPIDKDSAEHNPYNLKIVPHSEVDKLDFYTISSKGVTHFLNEVAEFTELEQWEAEYHLFQKILRIQLFRKYKMWKSYFIWRKNVRSRRMGQGQSALKDHLFILDPNLRAALLKVRDICHKISELRLYKIEPGKVYTMEDFVELHRQHKDAIQERLEFHFDELRATVVQACEQSLAAHGLLSDRTMDLYPDSDSEDEMSTEPSSSGASTGTAKNLDTTSLIRKGLKPGSSVAFLTTLAHNDDPNAMRYTQLAAKRTECRRLTNFIKLVDYLLIDTLHNLAVNSVKDILAKISPPPPPTAEAPKTDHATAPSGHAANAKGMKTSHSSMRLLNKAEPVKEGGPLFRIDIALQKEQLAFVPDGHTFGDAMHGVIARFVDGVVSVPKLINHSDFHPYTQPTLSEHYESVDMGEALDLATIIEDNETYLSVINSISETLKKSFDEAFDYAHVFDPYLNIFIDNKSLDINALRSDKNVPLDYFKDAVSKYKAEIEQMGRMPTVSVVGIIQIDSVGLKERLSPSPKICLYQIERLIPELAKAKNEELLSDLSTAIRKLTSAPASVEEFVEYLEFLQYCIDTQDEVQNRFQAVCDMYKMMEDYHVAIPPEENALYQTLRPTSDRLKEVIVMSESTKDAKMATFIQQLEQNIKNMRAEVVKVANEAANPIISRTDSETYDVLDFLNKLRARIQELKTMATNFKRYQERFKVAQAEFDDLDETYQDVEMKKLLWQSLLEWTGYREEWLNLEFDKVPTDEISSKVQAYVKICFQLERSLPGNPVVPNLRKVVDEFKAFMPVVSDLRNPALKQRHWERVQEIIGQRIVRDKNLTLSAMLNDLKVGEFREEIGNISASATSEAVLEDMLKKVENTWENTEFAVVPHKETKDFSESLYIITGSEEVVALLEDSQSTITTVRASRFVGPIKAYVEGWEKQLTLFAETIEEWMTCQRNWLYLESIFSSSDIQRQMPTEYKVFAGVDKSWKDLMRKTKDNPNALRACTAPGVLEMLLQNNVALEKIQKSLEDYLETKRLAFPRFYFLSNDELLQILAQTKNPHAVQVHLKKCFDNISKLEFTPEARSIDIVAMQSAEGEVVELGKNLKARGNVEGWLGNVEDAMQKSLRRLNQMAVAEYSKVAREDWMMLWPAQVVLAASQIAWAVEVIECFKAPDPRAALKAYGDKCVTQLNNLADVVRLELPALKRAMVGALVTIDVHARDNVFNLIKLGVSSESDFEWLKCLRYYWDPQASPEYGADVRIMLNNASFIYGNEYLGNTPRLVLTPLTDRCYMTLTGALHLRLGGAPAGPAGTGKTETVKDLAKALARQCVVFNCSDGLDYKMMGQFFSGLAQSGAWCCFDEFNRIDIEVLSVIAQQILTIRSAMSISAVRFVFEGREIKLNHNCGYFITMNPGYAGRTELPDNLKSLFRPVAMMIPDYALIAEIILYSEGFKSASILSKKMIQLYQLSSQQLSQQDHYDFGMRAVKSVLVMAGQLKRANADLPEDVVLIRSLRDSNLPKFLFEDIPLFQGIISDLFPGVVLPDNDYGSLHEAILECINSADLQPVPALVEKIIQLYETMNVRHGVMLVGPTGGGKTTCYRMLAAALSLLKSKGSTHPVHQKVNTYVLNPKCISSGELYGEFNKLTHEWTDGICANLVRKAVADTSPNHKWIIFDGPVDALWIEDMNTVLDDNKMLCLANGQRIKLTNSMHMMFEVEDLRVASPATVSRCGMVYMSSEVVGWRPIVKTWVKALPADLSADQKQMVYNMCDKYIDPGLAFVRAQCKESLPSMNMSLVLSFTALFESLMSDWIKAGKDRTLEESNKLLGLTFAFCYTWSIGGNIDALSQEKFDGFAREQFEGSVLFPGALTVYHYFVDFNTRTFRKWDDLVPPFQYSSSVPSFQLIVPTMDTVRYAYLLEKLIAIQKPVLFNGMTGVGKTVIVSDLLRNSEANNVIASVINFTAQTSSNRLQQIIEGKLEKKRRTLLGAPVGKKVVLFVDDVNMPQLETYGAQPPIELLRQYLDFHGFYDRKKLFWKDIQDVTVVAACGPPGGGRNPMTNRFMRHFFMLNIPSPSDESMRVIFGSILKGFLEEGHFSEEIQQLGRKTVVASVELYSRVCKELLPTPSRSHYTFNLRDLSKVFQGMLQTRRQTVPTGKTFVHLWIHESMRVFHDRLINQEDRDYFMEIIADLLRRQFQWENKPPSPLMFGGYMRGGGFEAVYEEITDWEKLQNVLDTYLENYNLTSSKEMNLILFRDAVEHLSRISRIIRQPRGNALLVGVVGSGKRSLTRLAAHMADYNCIELELTKNYGVPEFREDLKKLYDVAGVQGQPVVFLLSDSQITKEAFLEDINNILNSGEVPNLYEPDEYEKIIQSVQPLAKAAGLPEQRDVIYQYFVSRIQENLHIVLSMSPVGDNFRRRCRMFPSLVNCCTIDWFNDWPKDALRSVGMKFLAKVQLEPDDLREKIADLFVVVHQGVADLSERYYAEMRRRYYLTPTSYLELINSFIAILAKKRAAFHGVRDKLSKGVTQLMKTNEVVTKLQADLAKLQPELEKKAAETDKLLEKIKVDQEQADAMKKIVSKEEAEVSAQTKEIEALAADAQKDLDEALPALEASVKALNALNKNDISEIKSFPKPPDLVQIVMEAVCILLNQPDVKWATAKALLGDPNFLKRLLQFDKDNIPDSTAKKLKKYIDNPQFDPNIVAKQSVAAKSLCLWVRAIDTYSRVYKTVEPKRLRLAESQAAAAASKAKLQEKQDQMAAIAAKLAELTRVYNQNMSEKKNLQDSINDTKKKLDRAAKINSGLSEEGVRWGATLHQEEDESVNLVGNAFLGGAGITYVGAFTRNYRLEMMSTWMKLLREAKIAFTDDFNLVNYLSDPVVVRDWNIWGLPSDALSIENGILVTNGRRWPLMIDPQGQANKWIRRMEQKNKLIVLKQTDEGYLKVLDGCLKSGTPVLIENVSETLDPALEPVLLKQTFKSGQRLLIRFLDADSDYDPNFRLYLTTKLPNPHFLPEICIKSTIVNFTVTVKGLEDQLLGEVVAKERPEIEEKRADLIARIAADKKQLKDIEEKMLKLINSSAGNILEDEALINTLNDAKATSNIVQIRVKEAEETEKKLTTLREAYRPVAIRGSIIYFAIADLVLFDSMYQYSLGFFSSMYNKCIETSAKSDNLETRLNTLISVITRAVFSSVSRGLFERHKLLFAYMICVQVLKDEKKIADVEWGLFLKNAVYLAAVVEAEPNPDPSWITPNVWKTICALQQYVPAFENFCEDFTNNSFAWKEYVAAAEPHREKLPNPWDSRLTPFQKLLVLQALREDKLKFCILDFIESQLGKEFVDPPPFDLATAFKDTSPQTPLIFILSTGADPTQYLLRLAAERQMTERLHMVSLGQGQGPVAKQMIEDARVNGDWVYLQNCHLASSWMGALEKIVLAFSSGKIHEDFRLILSSMPSEKFPVSILQNGVKVTNEPPLGLKANLARSFADLTESTFEEAGNHGNAFKKLMFGLCFFHAIIQERKKFGALGWNITYEFTDSDLTTSMETLKMMLNEQPKVPWDALRYLTGSIHYAGRVTDDWDLRCLKSILNKFYVPEILQDQYVFSESGIYRAPTEGPLQSFRGYIDTLPISEKPEIFGLSPNADISYQTQEAAKIITNLVSIQPRTGGAKIGLSPDEIVLNFVTKTLAGLPQNLRHADAKEGLFQTDATGRMHSLSTVVSQEVVRFNRVLGTIRSTLADMEKAVKGLVVMSLQLEKMYNSILQDQVPEAWAKVSYPSMMPLSQWLPDLYRRIEFVKHWLINGVPDNFCFWLSGIFFPQGFLTAVLQTHARKYNVPIDSLSYTFTVLTQPKEEITALPEDGAYIYGLFLEGAHWDKELGILQPALPGVMFSEFPIIHFLPKVNHTPNPRDYVCPAYRTPARRGVLSTTGHNSNFLLAVHLPTDVHPDTWVLSGVALLSQPPIAAVD